MKNIFWISYNYDDKIVNGKGKKIIISRSRFYIYLCTYWHDIDCEWQL